MGIMLYLKNYLNKIIGRGNEKLAESISYTAEEVGNKYIKNLPKYDFNILNTLDII